MNATNKFILCILTSFLLIIVGNTAFAQQKIGHINSAELLSSMGEAKSAEKQLEAYTVKLDNQYKSKLKTFESEYKAVQAKAQKGEYSGKELAEQEKRFVNKEKEIKKFELEAQQKVMKKRDELLKPILQRVENAIKSVGKSGGYAYILDTSLGAILFAKDTEDVTAKVKAKLGL